MVIFFVIFRGHMDYSGSNGFIRLEKYRKESKMESLVHKVYLKDKRILSLVHKLKRLEDEAKRLERNFFDLNLNAFKKLTNRRMQS